MFSPDLLITKFQWLHKISARNLSLLYVIRTLKEVLFNVCLFFIPIYLFTLRDVLPYFSSLSLSSNQKGILLVASFYGISLLTGYITAISISALVRKLGLELSIILSFILRVGVFACLYFYTQSPLLLVLAGILEGLHSNFACNYFFNVLTEKQHTLWLKSEMGLKQFSVQLLLVLLPSFSGYLAYFYGFEVIFLFGSIVSIIAAVVMSSIHIHVPLDETSWQGFFDLLKLSKISTSLATIGSRYTTEAALLLWPLYVFIFLGNVNRVGYLYTLSLFLALLITFFVGNVHFQKSKRHLLISGGILSVIWLIRAQILSIWGFAIADALEKLLGRSHWRFFDWHFLKLAHSKQVYSSAVYQEMLRSSVGILIWVLIALLFILTTSWKGIFIFGAIGVLLSLLSHHHEKTSTTSS